MPKSCLPQTHLHIFHTSGKALEYSADTPGYVCCMSEPDVGTLTRSGPTRPQQNSNPGGFCKMPTKVRRQWSVRPECPRPGCSLPFPHPIRQEEVSSSATSWSNGPRHLSRRTVEGNRAPSCLEISNPQNFIQAPVETYSGLEHFQTS